MSRMSERELPKLWGVGDRLIADLLSSRASSIRFFAWSFPQTAPIVVFGILRVIESSGNQPSSKDLQNKDGTGGGVLAASLMLMLDREIGRESTPVFQ